MDKLLLAMYIVSFVDWTRTQTCKNVLDTSSVVRQKVKSQNGCYKKTKHARARKTRTCAYQGLTNVRFFGKFGVLCFLVTPVLKFALLPYCRELANMNF